MVLTLEKMAKGKAMGFSGKGRPRKGRRRNQPSPKRDRKKQSGCGNALLI